MVLCSKMSYLYIVSIVSNLTVVYVIIIIFDVQITSLVFLSEFFFSYNIKFKQIISMKKMISVIWNCNSSIKRQYIKLKIRITTSEK